MQTLAEPPVHRTTKRPLHPAYDLQSRRWALLWMMGEPVQNILDTQDEHGLIAYYIGVYRSQRMSPKRAERQLAHLAAGRDLRVIVGDGETAETPRPALRVLAGAR